MSHFQTFIAILQSVVSDITQAEGMSFTQKKTFAASLITTLLAANTLLTDEEKKIVAIIIPLLISDKQKVKGCLFGIFKKRKTPDISAPQPVPVIIPTPQPVPVIIPTPQPEVTDENV